MACAELLAMCLLSAKPGPAPRREPLPIFHDIFRRADKNDDGKLSFEEFKNYFADGILSSEELWELFSGIDRRHSDNVDTEKLCDYFSAYLGEYRNVLSALETLNSAVLAAMDKTKLRYETSSKMEQFLTRFLLRETMHQLQSLQGSLECAVDTMEEQAGRERKDVKKSETLVGLRSGRRCGRRGQKNVCLSPTDPYSGMLTTGTRSPAISEVCVGRGVCPCPTASRTGCKSSSLGHWDLVYNGVWTVAPRNYNPDHCGISYLSPEQWEKVSGEQPVSWFEEVMASSCSRGAQGCSCPRSVSACKLTDEACFILYEFWQDVTSWRSHLQSSYSKTFQRAIISLLESPELLTTMLFPASWWIMNNN
ncbi:NECA3 protein, partial [Anseranas semipalmata]|nr:NECA3 protein [Anseranas semipalmata]